MNNNIIKKIEIVFVLFLLVGLFGCSKKVVEHQVVFISNNEGYNVVESVNNNSILSLPIISYDGYSLVGWFTSDNNGVTLSDEWNFLEDTVTESITLYAKWSINSYTVIYSDDDGAILYEGVFEYGESLLGIEVNDPSKEGRNFIGWDSVIPDTMPANSVVIKATYEYLIFLENNELKITASDGAGGNYFGNNVQFKGDYIIVNSYGEDNFTGSIYIYKISDETYERKITASDGEERDYFGDILTIEGDYIIVTAYGYDNYTGSVYIYKLSDETYERKITASDGVEGDYFGYPIQKVGDYIMLGAYREDYITGAVYIYKISDEDYERKISTNDTEIGSVFGYKAYMDKDYVVISTSEGNDGLGTIYLYNLDNEDNIIEILPKDPLDEGYGFRVQLEGYYVIVIPNYSGTVYLYKILDPRYERIITISDESDGRHFNDILRIDGDYIIVNAYRDDYYAGAVYIYKLSDPSYKRKLVASDREAGDYFGYSIDISGDFVVIGAYRDDLRRGSIYIFRLSDESFEYKLKAQDGQPNDYFGYTVDIEGNFIVVGAYKDNSSTGAVYLYKLY